LRPGSAAVHELLLELERTGFEGAPRFLGVDEKGREILSYVDGDVPLTPYGPEVRSEAALVSVAGLLRRFHEAAPGWCHNDVAPYNIAFRGTEAVGLIDWDFAAPGPPAWDLAHAAWHCVPFQDVPTAIGHGWPPLPDRARRLRVLCDAYGLEDRTGFVALVADRIRSTEQAITSWAEAGDPVFQRLTTHLPMMRAARSFIDREGGRLQSAL
jgi:hypothetical protein